MYFTIFILTIAIIAIVIDYFDSPWHTSSKEY